MVDQDAVRQHLHHAAGILGLVVLPLSKLEPGFEALPKADLRVTADDKDKVVNLYQDLGLVVLALVEARPPRNLVTVFRQAAGASSRPYTGTSMDMTAPASS